MSSRPEPLGWLRAAAADRESAGLHRRLQPRPRDDDRLDLAGNDYLGLSRHAAVLAAAAAAVTTWGAGATGSRLVTGSTALHAELEAALAQHLGTAGALVFSSGYLANLGALAALSGRGSLVVSDAYNHASIVDGCRLGRARVAVAPHRDVDAVEKLLADRFEERALVVTDAVFSVDGELAPLGALHAAARRQGAVLLVDEAHALGVVGPAGRGAAAAAGLAGEPDVVLTATLSKALGSQGGVVLGDRVVIEHVIDTARAFIFDTGLVPAAAGAALAALHQLRDRPELAGRVRQRAREIAAVATSAGLPAGRPDAAVVGIPVGGPQRAVAAAATCLARGVRVGCFRPPSVPDGVSRLRLTARADLTDGDLDRLAGALAAVAAAAGRGVAGGIDSAGA